uniref:Uncharacterized protein n=1 Tax=Oryctolagus cuniculus TaxID=9986 RepID=A0A5F9CVD3_RABIT
MPLLSATAPSAQGGFPSQASEAGPSLSPWLPPATGASPAPGVLCRDGGVCSCPAASSGALAAASPCRAARFSLRASGLAIKVSLEDDEPAAPLLAAVLPCPLTPALALLASFLLVRPCPAGPRFFSVRWKMEGTAVGLSRRCWSSSLLEKLSLVKCSLQRNEYLVGVQLSL